MYFSFTLRTILLLLIYGQSIAQINSYSRLSLDTIETISLSPGLKSVLFNTDKTRLYVFHLEKMNIKEFDRSNRKCLREFMFRPHQSDGWDYQKDKAIPSFAEKPVEGSFSHHDSLLWVSLHNAGGVSAIPLIETANNKSRLKALPYKTIYVKECNVLAQDTIFSPFFKTGKTPKVIAISPDQKYMLVSNWHAKNLSIFEINSSMFPYARKIKDISLSGIPRGIAICPDFQKAFITIINDQRIAVLNTKTWKLEKSIPVYSRPRHIVAGKEGHLFISFTNPPRIACLQASSGKILFKSTTGLQPRTIALSNDQRFLFVTCYEGNAIEVFKINTRSFERVYRIPCKGKPVGIDLYEDQDKLEAWICNYLSGTLNVVSFRKK